MTTTIRHVTLKSLGKNKDIDLSKGTVTNPFTQEEYDSLCNTGEWPGGYVETMGYVAPPMMDGMGDGSGSGSNDGITYVFDNSGNCTIQYNESGIFMVNANGHTLSLSHPIIGYPSTEFDPSSSGQLVFRGPMALYWHLANYIPVEWAASYNSDNDTVISTSHQQTHGDANSIVGYASYIHSHPNGVSQPSDSDINTWIGMFRSYMRNVLGECPEGNSAFGMNYQNFSIYAVDNGQGTVVDQTEDYVLDYFKFHANYNDSELWKRYKKFIKQ